MHVLFNLTNRVDNNRMQKGNNPVKMIIYFKDNIVEILSFRQDRIYRQNELSDSFRSLNRIN